MSRTKRKEATALVHQVVPPAGIQRQIQVALIDTSPNNPRKLFDAEKLKELAADIAEHGLLQPILVRPNPPSGQYELVAGERRLRAVRSLQWFQVSAIVVDVDDARADEIRLTENLQRVDLSAIEEADGYARLRDHHGLTVDRIAERIGRSRRHVYQRLQLTQLGPEARAALEDGRIDASIAVLVAGVPGTNQKKFLADIVGHYGRSMTFREAEQRRRQHYQRSLKQAPFSLTAALAEKPKCGDCPSNLSNQPESEGKNYCTDLACWGQKAQAARREVEAKIKQKGLAIMPAADARNVLDYGGGRLGLYGQATNWIDLDDACPEDKHDPKRSWRKVLGEHAPAATVAITKSNKALHLAAKFDAYEALRAAGVVATSSPSIRHASPARAAAPAASGPKSSASSAGRTEAIECERRYREAFDALLVEAALESTVHGHLWPFAAAPALRLAIRDLVENDSELAEPALRRRREFVDHEVWRRANAWQRERDLTDLLLDSLPDRDVQDLAELWVEFLTRVYSPATMAYSPATMGPSAAAPRIDHDGPWARSFDDIGVDLQDLHERALDRARQSAEEASR